MNFWAIFEPVGSATVPVHAYCGCVCCIREYSCADVRIFEVVLHSPELASVITSV